ncbi:protein INVOLVED IN DE NOVO 2-like isoform X2 [Nicotiana tomentosiformis]|uniref:protein INVOLVED IN DE NOVO 2-like isoform X2 n=1 Tax=Nicotiana tomentosiformis TaxID=4098 RepID=UPI00051B5BBF|nr:protein INVOLVED IN DE NOVO 2-like isoform X2 [Nicotiana tomentosiformis]XP_009610605.1 protein INVOLVED IN DE NOVO 2-like isoform X2 [Nicotiana tomentosiformis]XP_018628986.1 protein INVOLVED IN DE NOVO 2-like isoform X2 [Nicotiana tomentosiformis]XP_033514092.1 protein INVOLVED IN DE NOVO 2-like isoform X2 [Nicotiana tomentosiformis]
MEHCYGEDADITESEIEDYKEKSYEELRCGNQSFKISDVAYTCPYCQEKSGRHLFYEDLLQHASGIGKSKIRTARDRANHLALAKYLENDVAGAAIPSKSNKELNSGNHSFRKSDVVFACPYCPETRKRGFSYKDLLQHANGIGSSNSTKRTARDTANHLALAKRLENNVAGSASSAKYYEDSRSGNHSPKISNMAFACPYCPETRERVFSYKDLLQHANGIGSSNSLKRTARDKVNHLALAKRLEKDVAGSASSSKSYEESRNVNHSFKLSNMTFACPYCPETRNRDFSYKDLFQHVYSVGNCNSITRTASDKANHLALAKSMENDLAGAAGPSKSYEEMKTGNHSLKIPDMAFARAYCPERRNREFLYKDLLQHASGVRNGNSKKRTARDSANHLPLVKHLDSDVAGPLKAYEELESGKQSFNISERTFACAYCSDTRNRDFSYKDLLQHAVGVGSCDSKKRTARDKANHLALAKHLQNFATYLENDVASAPSTSISYEKMKSNHSFNNSDVAFACPYCPETRNKDFSYKDLLQHAGGVGSCNSKKRTARDKANHLALAKYLASDVAGSASSSIPYEKLKSGNYSLNIPAVAYTFAYCPKKRKREFMYKDLMFHVREVGSCSSNKRTAIDKANHLTLAKYFENDVALAASPSKPDTLGDPQVDTLLDYDRAEMFVWPWIAVVVNLPTEFKDGRYVGESGSNLKDQLIRRGFNPTRVRTLWNDLGHSGIALVEFKKDWSGFSNAILFEKAYEADYHGKKDWEVSNGKKSDLYAWIARADDYQATNVVGEKLQKFGDLRTLPNIMEEESRKTRKLVSSLTNAIEIKKLNLKMIEDKYKETSQSVEQLIVVNAKLRQSYNEEIKKIQSSSRDHFQQTFINHEKLKLQLETQKKELELRHTELQKREAQNESDRKKMSEDLEQNAILKTSLSAAIEEQRNVDEKVPKMAEELKKQKEELHKRIIKLEKQLVTKQAGEIEVERLRVTMKQIEEEANQEVLQKVDTLLKDLREKEEKYEDLVALNQTLIVKERKSNDELQEALKELVNGLKELPRNGPIGVKRMGELDSRPFLEAMKRRYNEVEAEEIASELCSLWEEYLRDPEWHPIKVISINGKHQAVIDDEDEKLKGLKKTYGEEVYKAVTTALTEINVYNPSGGYIICELWNYDVAEKATLQEGVTVLLNLWKKKMTLD